MGEDFHVLFLHALVFVQLGDVHAELIALFEDAFAPFGDEFVESVGESRHAVAELVEAEVYAGEGVGH